jgi:hypothetical protein
LDKQKMTKRKVHIENLRIRIPGAAAGQARNIAGGLGREILREVAESTAGKIGTKSIGELSAGKIKVSGGAGVAGSQGEIARRVAAEVKKRFE